jgi:hypothetical protein
LQQALLVPVVDNLICAALRGENPPWPWEADAAQGASLLDRAEFHGVGPLLHSRLANTDWPPVLTKALRAQALQQAMWELRHQQVLTQTLAALHALGIEPILIKGTALAYSLYDDPVLRTRGDTDLIIPPGTTDRVHDALLALGFERSLGVSGEVVSYQATYSMRTDNGGAHALDLHWKINNSELLSLLFKYEELQRVAQPLPRLSPHAFGTDPIHAFLLACMHRSTHKRNPYHVNGREYHDPDRLIWLYDIHLLAAGLDPAEWDEVTQLAQQKGLRAVCLEGMEHARACFHTRYPASVMAALARKGPEEQTARYLAGNRLSQQWMDFVALGSASRRLQWLGESFFPPASYMNGKFPTQPRWMLPLLYLGRAIGGVARRLVRPRRS